MANDALDTYWQFDQWAHEIVWRLKETKDIVLAPLYAENKSATFKRDHLMMGLQNIAYSMSISLHQMAYDYMKNVMFRYERICDMSDITNVRSVRMPRKQMDQSLDSIQKIMIPMCIKIAKNDHAYFRMSFDEAFQNALIGVMKASRVYDIKQGLPFPVFARYFIYTTLSRDSMDHTIEISEKKKSLYSKVVEFNESFYRKTGEYPSLKETAFQFGCTPQEINDALCYHFKKSTFLDTSIIANTIESDTNIEEYVQENDADHLLYNIIDSFDQPFKDILNHMIGRDFKDMTLYQMALHTGVSAKKYAVLKDQALEHLKQTLDNKGLKFNDFF